MTGLITKDFLVMRKMLRSYLLMIVVYTILAYLDFFDYSFIISFVQVALSVLPISAFAYDEQSKWDRYAMSLPLGRSRVVGARYLFVLLLTLFTVAFGLAGTALLYLTHQSDPLEMFVTLMVSTTIGLLIPTILLPLSYKLGAERARPYLYAIVFIPVIAVVLLAKAGGETEKQIYRFTKGDSDLSLRFDLTVPLAKYVALNYVRLAFPFRRFQIGKVYRGERAQRGRFREFYQADIDVIGDGALDILNDAEMPAIIYRAFTSLGLDRFVIRVNNRKILSGFYAIIEEEDKAPEIMRLVDKVEKIGLEKVGLMLVDDLNISEDTVGEIVEFMAIKGSNQEVLTALEEYRGRNEAFDQGLDELKTVCRYLVDFGVPETHFAIDLSIARGLDYYTGTVYETRLLDYPEIGSPCSGGRYDNLAAYYTEKTTPPAWASPSVSPGSFMCWTSRAS